MTWSRSSRRMVPITRSAKGFCHGDRSAVRSSVVPTCAWPKLDLKGVDHTTAPSKTAADKESQKSAGLRDERRVNGSPVWRSFARAPVQSLSDGDVEAELWCLRRAADVAVVQSADLRQRNDLTM